MIRERHVFLFIGGYLLLAWAAVIAVDVWNALGLREIAGERLLWIHLFANGKPTEWVQWYMLGATAFLAAFFAGRYAGDIRQDVNGQAYFWGVMGVALVLMLIEDAGDVRHEIRRIVEFASGSPRHTGDVDKAVEFAYFGVLAFVPLYALMCYGKYLRSCPRTFAYVLGGFALYGTAAVGNATRNWGSWYAALGVRIYESTGMMVPDGRTPEEMGHWFVDAVLEETLETLGGMFFLAAAISYFWRMKSLEPVSKV